MYTIYFSILYFRQFKLPGALFDVILQFVLQWYQHNSLFILCCEISYILLYVLLEKCKHNCVGMFVINWPKDLPMVIVQRVERIFSFGLISTCSLQNIHFIQRISFFYTFFCLCIMTIVILCTKSKCNMLAYYKNSFAVQYHITI